MNSVDKNLIVSLLIVLIIVLLGNNSRKKAEQYETEIQTLEEINQSLEEKNKVLEKERDKAIDEKMNFEEQLWEAEAEIERLEEENKQEIQTEEKSDKPTRSGSRNSTIYCKLTAYSPYDNQSGIEGGGITSTEKTPCKKYCAVDPKKIPYGTILEVPGYGIVEAQDTGSALRKYRDYQVDLYMDTYKEAVDFGVQYKEVRILQWGGQNEY